MLKNAYLGAKIGFDTAANELSKVGCAASYQLYLYLLSGTQPELQGQFLRRLLPGSLTAQPAAWLTAWLNAQPGAEKDPDWAS